MILIVSFDLAWTSPTGWASLKWEEGYRELETGTIITRPGTKLQLEKGGFSGEAQDVVRADSLADSIISVLVRASSDEPGRMIVAYESPVKWLLAASRSRRRNKPVTRVSLMAMAQVIGVFRTAVGGWWGERLPDYPVEIVPVDTRAALAQFGMGDFYCPRGDIEKLLELGGYADEKKVLRGLAVAARLETEGLTPVVPETDHEADAALFAFVVMDNAIQAERGKR